MSICRALLICSFVSILISQQAVGQEPGKSDNSNERKAAEQRSEQGKDSSNAQWSEGATRGQDRAAEVRSEPEREKEQSQDMKKGGEDTQDKQKEAKQQKKNNSGKKK